MTLEESRALDYDPARQFWFYWEAMGGRMAPTHRDYVPLGFYRKDNRDGRSWPCVIWIEGATKLAQIGSGEKILLDTPQAEADFAERTFQYVAKKPISYEAYQFWKANRAWPIETAGEAAVEESLQVPRGIGDNSAGPATDLATWLDQVAAALKGLEAASAVDSDAKADAAQSLRSRLTELAGEGDKLRAAEKQPHLDASRAVDEKWMPTIKEAKDGGTTLRRAIEAHATKKLREERERQAAEEALRKPIVTQGPAEQPDRAVAAAPAEAPKAAIGGGYGRRTSAKVRRVVDTIDYRQVCDQFCDTNKELQALLVTIAQRVIDIDGTVRGVTTKEVARIR
jgi:hypothetical protein